MLLLKRLIRNKQNTVMTNTQIIEILKEEFGIDVKTCHELEVDIYIKIIKKFLKDWPQWEELERISTKLSTAKDYDAVTKVLNLKYKNMKEYLGVMLDAAKPLAKKAVADVEPDPSKTDNVDSQDVVMDVFCTRNQLNHLFFRKPRTDLNNSIFNISKIEPKKIYLNTLSFESILNFWWTKIHINLPCLVYLRELMYKHNHTLVNKVREVKPSTEVMDTTLQCRGKKIRVHPKKTLLQTFDKIIQVCNDEDLIQLLQVIFHVLKGDLEAVPDTVKVPSSYRRCANRYKYVRYLYVENEANDDPKYDLQLQEMVAPIYQFFVGRLTKVPDAPLPPINDWLKIECMACKVKFTGSTELMTILQAHFNDSHQHEPEWQCPQCKRLFGVDFLSKNKWQHEC